MNAVKAFVKSTVVGGLLFLVPVILLLLVLRHAMQFAGKIAVPIAALFPASQIGGVALASIIAVLVLVLVAFLAGLVARTAPGHRVTTWFEESILGGLPQYQMAKTVAEGLAQVESGHTMKPVLVLIDEGWQLAYKLEDLPGGWVAVFVPQSPTPMSGNVMYVDAGRVKPIDLPMKDAVMLIKRLGIGSGKALAGVQLSTTRPA